MRFIDTVDGLNEIFSSDIPKGSIVLVTGSAGSLKSGFTFAMMSNYLENTDEYGVYITLEQNKESHLANIMSMGINVSDRLLISDYSNYRLQFGDESADLFEVITTNILQYKKKMGDKFTCLVIDSLGALYTLMDLDPSEIRKRLYHLFEPLRREGLTTFAIFETENVIGDSIPMGGVEGYLADGIIELGIHTTEQTSKRYIKVKKMRASSHSMDPWILTVSDDGIRIYKNPSI
ncbi:MAG: ATPase domain-containing protein [Euryarchaeota archaeon]|nr:ATPase domain-containing protein [Euryarchaeota archaeon]